MAAERAPAIRTDIAERPRRRRGRPPRTDPQRAAHRRRLLAAAMDAVRTHGADVSIEQMADAAGVSKPVLYAEFGDKLGVVDAIARVLADRVERTVASTLGRIGPPTEGRPGDRLIRAVVEALVTVVGDEPQLYAFFVRNLRSNDQGFLDNALMRAVHDRAATLIARPTTAVGTEEVSILVDGVFGFVFGAVESWLRTRRPDKPRLVERLSAVVRAGVVEATTVNGPAT